MFSICKCLFLLLSARNFLFYSSGKLGFFTQGFEIRFFLYEGFFFADLYDDDRGIICYRAYFHHYYIIDIILFEYINIPINNTVIQIFKFFSHSFLKNFLQKRDFSFIFWNFFNPLISLKSWLVISSCVVMKIDTFIQEKETFF